MFRQLQVLLGLFKSYKPECVPEDVPAISIHTAFKKINVSLLSRFKRIQVGNAFHTVILYLNNDIRAEFNIRQSKYLWAL